MNAWQLYYDVLAWLDGDEALSSLEELRDRAENYDTILAEARSSSLASDGLEMIQASMRDER